MKTEEEKKLAEEIKTFLDTVYDDVESVEVSKSRFITRTTVHFKLLGDEDNPHNLLERLVKAKRFNEILTFYRSESADVWAYEIETDGIIELWNLEHAFGD